MRVGWGFDAHRFGEGAGEVRLCGVVVAHRLVEATSDGDVAAHALIDALLGAAALGDIGELFPSSDPQWEGADSMAMLADVVSRLAAAGMSARSVDITVIAQTVRVAPLRREIRSAVAAALGIGLDQVSVKATTTDGLGWLGKDAGIAASAVAVVSEG